jgi:hypothetical protein
LELIGTPVSKNFFWLPDRAGHSLPEFGLDPSADADAISRVIETSN